MLLVFLVFLILKIYYSLNTKQIESQESNVIGECHKKNAIENLNAVDFQLRIVIKCYWLAKKFAFTIVHRYWYASEMIY